MVFRVDGNDANDGTDANLSSRLLVANCDSSETFFSIAYQKVTKKYFNLSKVNLNSVDSLLNSFFKNKNNYIAFSLTIILNLYAKQ